MSGTLTKEDLKTGLRAFHEGVSAEITEAKRDIIHHVNEGQELNAQRFDEVDVKLAAIMEMLAMRHELRNLVRELKTQGIKLEETKIFAT